MKTSIRNALVVGICLLSLRDSVATPYAERVVAYRPGEGAAPGYDKSETVLGEPARTAPAGPVDLPVTPFNPPWAASQLVSIGKGGSLTVELGTPVRNQSSNPYGIDLILFGNNGFKVNDYSVPEADWTTDGTLFTFDPPGSSKIWVSSDNIDYYELVAPEGLTVQVDSLFPTDGAGDFQTPVNPNLHSSDFNGRTLAGIRALYSGSAGGTGFDLAWARRSDGSAAGLDSAQYVRIDVLDGKVELDAFVVVPEPSTVALFGLSLAMGCGLYQGVTSRRRSGPLGNNRKC